MDEIQEESGAPSAPERSGRRGFLVASAAAAVLAGAVLDGCSAQAAQAASPAAGGAASNVLTVGTGSKSDVADLATALALMPFGGGRIQLGKGTQTLTGHTNPPGADTQVVGGYSALVPSNVVIEGEGEGITILSGVPHTGSNMLGGYNQSNIVLRGFTLNGGGNGGYGIALFQCTDCLVEDVTVIAHNASASLNTAIGEFGSRNRFVRCSVSGARTLGFELGYSDDRTEVISCSATGCMFGLQFDGYGSLPPNMRKTPNQNIRVISSDFSGNGLGLLLTSVHSAVVADCVLSDNTGYGLAVAALGAGNWQNLAPYPGSKMHVVCSGLLVSGNNVGVRLQGTGSQVSSSVFMDNKTSGVLLEGDGLIVNGCSFPSGNACVQNSGSSGCVVLGCTRSATGTKAGLIGDPSGVTLSASPGF